MSLDPASGQLVGRPGQDLAGPRRAPDGFVLQEAATIPAFAGRYPVLGSWLVASQPCELGIREDAMPITKNTSRFVPHIIEP